MQEGFRYHHAEPTYLMLVYWIPESESTIPLNASHRVRVGAVVLNHNKEVLTSYYLLTCSKKHRCFAITMRLKILPTSFIVLGQN